MGYLYCRLVRLSVMGARYVRVQAVGRLVHVCYEVGGEVAEGGCCFVCLKSYK